MLSGRKILWAANAVGLRLRGMQIAFPGFIGPTLFILGRRNIKVGKRVRIWPGLRVEVFEGATLTIEDNVVIGANCHITIASDMTIGSGSNFTGANVITNITHTLQDMHKPSIDRPWEVTPVHLGKNLFVGHGAKILPGTTLANGCVVGANAVVANLSAPENAVVAGIPGKMIRVIS
jgi:acetyltransferase-like isoleucine patch superfamily enzyme